MVSLALLLLCLAVSGVHVLQPVLDYLHAISPPNPMVSATAGAGALLALCIAYFTGTILVFLRVAPAPPALVSPAALRLFAFMACALLLPVMIITPLLPWLQ